MATARLAINELIVGVNMAHEQRYIDNISIQSLILKDWRIRT